MSVGRFDESAYSVSISGVGIHVDGQWPINLNNDAIGVVTATIAAFVVGTPGDGFGAELKAAYRVSGGVLSIGPVSNSLPIEAFGSAVGVSVDIDVNGEYITLLVDGLSGINFDVDTLWKGWSTA